MNNINHYCDDDFEWDVNKNAINLQKHKIDFEIAKLALSDPNVVTFEGYFAGDEFRYDAIGKVTEASYVRVTFTFRETDDGDRKRIISARKADRKEKGIYDEKVFG